MKIKKNVRIGLILASVLIVLIIFAISFQENTCAKLTGTSHLRAPIYTYEFNVSGKKYKGNFYQIDSKLSLDELKKLDCIKIEYNSLIPWVNRIDDTKIVDK